MTLLDPVQAEAVRPGTHITEPNACPTRSMAALRCATCGYAIASYRSIPNCPMCHTRTWILDHHTSSIRGRRLP